MSVSDIMKIIEQEIWLTNENRFAGTGSFFSFPPEIRNPPMIAPIIAATTGFINNGQSPSTLLI